jgi:hypothetical protein
MCASTDLDLWKIDRLEWDVFEREYWCEQPTCRRRTEHHLRFQVQGSSGGFDVQKAEVRMTTVHSHHHRDRAWDRRKQSQLRPRNGKGRITYTSAPKTAAKGPE